MVACTRWSGTWSCALIVFLACTATIGGAFILSSKRSEARSTLKSRADNNASSPDGSIDSGQSIAQIQAATLAGSRRAHSVHTIASAENVSSGARAPPQRRFAAIAKEAKKHASKEGVVLWTLANSSWLDFVLNWVETVKKAKIQHFFVAALDDELARALNKRGIPCVMLHAHLGGGDLSWGSDAFKERGMEKIQFIISMLEQNLQPMFSDLDVAWLRDPLPFVTKFTEPNILISSDSCHAQTLTPLDNCPELMGTDRQVRGKGAGTWVGMMNVGIHLIRPSAVHFAKAWLQEMKSSGEMEQLCWNVAFMRSLSLNDSRAPDLYCRSMSETIKAGLLPAAMFMNGHTYFAQHLQSQANLDPIAVHASWVAGTESKLWHFREENLWLVDKDERFNGDSVRLLWLELDIPPALLNRSGPPAEVPHQISLKDAEGHFHLIRHQYLQVKAAAEMALALNRTLIMPKLFCGIENLWDVHNGRYWAGLQNYTLPMPCSMTQLFEVLRWKNDAKEFRELPEFVESSFLDNPKLKLTEKDVATLDSCGQSAESASKCFAGNFEENPSNPSVLQIAPPVNKTDFRNLMKDTGGMKLLKVRSVLDFWPLATKAQYSRFDEAYDSVRRDWCCAQGKKRVYVDVASRSASL